MCSVSAFGAPWTTYHAEPWTIQSIVALVAGCVSDLVDELNINKKKNKYQNNAKVEKEPFSKCQNFHFPLSWDEQRKWQSQEPISGQVLLPQNKNVKEKWTNNPFLASLLTRDPALPVILGLTFGIRSPSSHVLFLLSNSGLTLVPRRVKKANKFGIVCKLRDLNNIFIN